MALRNSLDSVHWSHLRHFLIVKEAWTVQRKVEAHNSGCPVWHFFSDAIRTPRGLLEHPFCLPCEAWRLSQSEGTKGAMDEDQRARA